MREDAIHDLSWLFSRLDDKSDNCLIHYYGISENDYDESPIGNIEEIIDLYDGVKDYNGFLICAYCHPPMKYNKLIVLSRKLSYHTI